MNPWATRSLFDELVCNHVLSKVEQSFSLTKFRQNTNNYIHNQVSRTHLNDVNSDQTLHRVTEGCRYVIEDVSGRGRLGLQHVGNGYTRNKETLKNNKEL